MTYKISEKYFMTYKYAPNNFMTYQFPPGPGYQYFMTAPLTLFWLGGVKTTPLRFF